MIKIGQHNISDNARTFIIAELSANHKQDFNLAAETVKAAKKAGADAIKLQTFTPDTITLNCDNKYFRKEEGLWKGMTLYQLYEKAYMPWQWHEKLKNIAEDEGLVCFSSPFDNTAVDFLEKLNMPAYKIASFEITDIPLIEYTAAKGKPMIISTGIAEMDDIERAIEACKKAGNEQIIILKCTSAYPATVEEANLLSIPYLREKFNVMVGLSDHTTGITVPVVATTLGARVIEKHFILDNSIESLDAPFSLDVNAFAEMVNAVREAEKAIGNDSDYKNKHAAKRKLAGRSLFVVKQIKKGEKFTEENIRSIRPGNGLHPMHYYNILGKIAAKDIEKGSPLNWADIEQ